MHPAFSLESNRALNRTRNHLYLAPHPLLRPYVAHYTFTVPGGPPTSGALTIIPDASGCIVFSGAEPHGLVWGATTQAADVQNDLSAAPVRFFVEFLPGGLYFLTGIPQSELTDRQFMLDELNPALYAGFSCLMERAQNADELADGADQLLLGLLGRWETPPALSAAQQRLRRTDGMLPVSELAREGCYSERHYARLFSNCLGMGVKTYSRLVRVNAAIRRLQRHQPLTMLAQEAGFYDQAHFIHDFRQICGVAPTAYLDNLSDFYNEIYKF